jgi:gliding motility-associated-like protein
MRLVLLLLLVLFVNSIQAQIIGIKIAGDTCSSLTLALQAEGTSSSPYFFWHFGDPASGLNDTVTITGTSPSPFPTHTFTSPGIYTVCVSFQELGMPIQTVCRTISIGQCCGGYITSIDSCVNQPIGFGIISAYPILSVQWLFGDPQSGSNNTANTPSAFHVFSSAQSYTVKAIVKFNCGYDTLEIIKTVINCNTPSNTNCPIFLPNAFTPNNDNNNDGFTATTTCEFKQYALDIYNRWGQLVFHASDPQMYWDGTFKGQDCPAGIYFYCLQYQPINQPKAIRKGDVLLLR